jgi:hypothetical protein
MATPSTFNPNPSVPRPNWFAGNWKWVVPLGIVCAVLLVASFVGFLLYAVESSIQHGWCYKQALARARANPKVIEKFGQPIEPGWLVSGSFNSSGSSGDANIAIPIHGPKAKGTIYVVAKKSAGEWNFETLKVEVEGESKRIDLLKPEDNQPGTTETTKFLTPAYASSLAVGLSGS